MLATLASQIPILAPALPLLGSGVFDLTPFDQKTGHPSLRVCQDPHKLIFLSLFTERFFKESPESLKKIDCSFLEVFFFKK